jgi:hypothetical protein
VAEWIEKEVSPKNAKGKEHMNTVWRITDKRKGQVIYMEKKPHVRRYMMENLHYNEIKVEEINWHYKHELVQLLNDSVEIGLRSSFKEHD